MCNERAEVPLIGRRLRIWQRDVLAFALGLGTVGRPRAHSPNLAQPKSRVKVIRHTKKINSVENFQSVVREFPKREIQRDIRPGNVLLQVRIALGFQNAALVLRARDQ